MNPFDPFDTSTAFEHPGTQAKSPINTTPHPHGQSDGLFHEGLSSVVAGQSVSAKCAIALNRSRLLEAGSDLINGLSPQKVNVDWQLVDTNGVVYAIGYAQEIRITVNTSMSIVEAMAIVSVPDGLPPTSINQRYLLSWTLTVPEAKHTLDANYVSPLEVKSPYSQTELGFGATGMVYGPTNAVEITGKPATCKLYLDHAPDATVTPGIGSDVIADLYLGNTLLGTYQPTTTKPLMYQGFDAYVYEVSLPSRPASLDAYNIVWRWSRNNASTMANASVWWVTPSILSAMSSVTAFVAKAGAYTIGHPDAIFDDVTLLNWLQRGRDAFNLATGRVTEFTMMNASGVIREIWIRYCEMLACRAQSLAESEKAFNFSSGATTLDVDKAAAYESAAAAIDAMIEKDIDRLKQNLLIKGLTGGDGNMLAAKPPTLAVVGISLTPASQSRFRYGAFR